MQILTIVLCISAVAGQSYTIINRCTDPLEYNEGWGYFNSNFLLSRIEEEVISLRAHGIEGKCTYKHESNDEYYKFKPALNITIPYFGEAESKILGKRGIFSKITTTNEHHTSSHLERVQAIEFKNFKQSLSRSLTVSKRVTPSHYPDNFCGNFYVLETGNAYEHLFPYIITYSFDSIPCSYDPITKKLYLDKIVHVSGRFYRYKYGKNQLHGFMIFCLLLIFVGILFREYVLQEVDLSSALFLFQ